MDTTAGDTSPVHVSTMLPVFGVRTRLLVVAPHPDDETIATGLLIQQVVAAGGTVKILLLTPGDNNPWPQRWLERRRAIRAVDRQRWGERRQGELLEALRCLGAPASALEALGMPDMGATEQLLQSCGSVIATMDAAIRRFGPDLIALPSLDDRHPDHGTANVIVRLALAKHAETPLLLEYLVHGRARTPHGNIELSGSAGQLASKMTALTKHGTQMTLSAGRMRRLATRAERYAGVANGPIAAATATALPWRPAAWLRRWLRLSVVSGGQAQSWRWSDAPLRRDSDGTFHLLPGTLKNEGPRFVRMAWNLHTFWIFDRWGWREL